MSDTNGAPVRQAEQAEAPTPVPQVFLPLVQQKDPMAESTTVGADETVHTTALPAVAIAIGDIVDSAISTAGEVDTYTFSATAGQKIFFDVQAVSNFTGISWSLRDAFDTVIAFDGFFNDHDVITLFDGGAYTLIIDGNEDNTGTYRFKLWNVPPPEQFAINIGDIVNINIPSAGAGRIEQPGVYDVYTFSATAGQKLFFDGQAVSNFTGISWSLRDAFDTVIASDGFFNDSDVITLDLSSFSSNSDAITLVNTGTYKLIVDGNGDNTSTYRFKIWNVPSPDQFDINIGDIVNIDIPGTGAGRIEQPGVYDVYTFAATAGQKIFFDAQTVANFTGISWSLRDGFDTLIASDGFFNDSDVITLLDGGAYTLIVDGNGDNTSTYRFKLWNVPAPNQFAINIGDIVNIDIPGAGAGRIEQPGVYDVYTFSATAGQKLFFDAQTVANFTGISWSLRDAFDTVIASDGFFNDSDVITLFDGGAYKLIVDGNGDNTGTYRFKLWNVPAPNQFAINIGDSVNVDSPGAGAGRIEQPGVYDVYTFAATAGQKILFDVQGVSNLTGISWSLRDAFDTIMATDGFFRDSDVITLLNGGAYKFIVDGNGDNTGTYAFRLYDPDAPAATATATPTRTPTATATPNPTATPTNTPTLMPTATPTTGAVDTSLQVDTTSDNATLADCVDSTPGDCSLRGALQKANGRSDLAYTIAVPAGVYQLTLTGANEENNATGDLDVRNTTGVTVQGAGAAATFIQAGSNTSNGIDRVLEVRGNGKVTLQGVTVRYGQAVGGGPGAIFNQSNSVLTIIDSAITDNTSVTNGMDKVGGIWNYGQLTVLRTSFTANTAGTSNSGDTSAIENRGGVAQISESTFSSNNNRTIGNSAQLTLTDSTFVGNHSGIYNNTNATITIERSTFSNNQSSSIYSALFNGGTATVRNSTLSGNTAFHSGGVFNSGTLTVENSTLTANRATESTSGGNLYNNATGTVHLRNTILANSAGGADCKNNNIIATNTNNLIEDGSCAPLLSGDPNLGPLQNNGGGTQTHALLLGSLAIDAGNNATCAATDQRGSARPVDGNGDGSAVCDLGAYEAAGTVPPTHTPTATPTATATRTPTATPTPTSTTMPGAVAVTLPTNAAGAPNSQVTIPVLLPNSVSGHSIIAYNFRLTFNPAVLTFAGASTTDTLSNGWNVTPNSGTPGAVQVVAFNATALSGSGTLINLHFNVVGSTGSSTALTWTDFVFNEGSPVAQTSNGLFTVNAWRVGGSVSYRTTTRSMAGVTIALSGASQSQATTTSSGAYSFTLQASGVHTVTPSLSGQVNSISAFDAAYVAQCVAGVRALSDCPLLAADASGNNALSAFDAAQIAQYVAGLAAPNSRVGRWLFSPASRSYGTLTADLLTEGYAAYLVGEVSGNWQAPAVTAAGAGATGPAPLLAASRDDRTVALDSAAPVSDLLAFQMTLHYDPAAGRLHTAHLADALSAAGWELLVHEATPGVVEIVAYGVTPVQDGRELVTLHFHNAAGQPIALTPTLRRVQLNEDPHWLDAAQMEEMRQQYFLPLISH